MGPKVAKRKSPSSPSSDQRVIKRRRSPHQTQAAFRSQVVVLYGEVVGPYKNARTPVLCRCQYGHSCSPHPYSLLGGGGLCRACAGLDPIIAEAEFRSSVLDQKGEMTGKYVNRNTRVDCICEFGHKCSPLPASVHAGGRICHTCRGAYSHVSEEKFLAILEEAGAEPLESYKGTKKTMQVKCAKGHVRAVMPQSVFLGFCICNICSGASTEVSGGKFVTKITNSGGKVRGKYVNATTRVECECPKGHQCFPVPAYVSYYDGGMCKVCRETRGERCLKELFQELKMDVEKQYFLPNPPEEWPGRRPFDFAFEMTCYEFDGIQHFTPVERFGGQKPFDEGRQRDIEKTQAAIANGRKLIRIHFNFLKRNRVEQMRFLKAAIASTENLVVDRLEYYDWLADFNPVTV